MQKQFRQGTIKQAVEAGHTKPCWIAKANSCIKVTSVVLLHHRKHIITTSPCFRAISRILLSECALQQKQPNLWSKQQALAVLNQHEAPFRPDHTIISNLQASHIQDIDSSAKYLTRITNILQSPSSCNSLVVCINFGPPLLCMPPNGPY